MLKQDFDVAVQTFERISALFAEIGEYTINIFGTQADTHEK